MKKLLTLCAITGVLFAATIEVHAAVYGVASRQELAGDDYVNWGDASMYNYAWHVDVTSAPISILSVGGASNVTAELPSEMVRFGSVLPTYAAFGRRTQSCSWGGNFAPYDTLLGMFKDIYPGPMVFSFDPPVYGAGTQINGWQYGAFNATIEAYDSNGNNLGTFSFNNLAVAYTADNSAGFIGVLSETPDIARIVIAIGMEAFVINQLDLVTNEPTFPANTLAPCACDPGYNTCEKVDGPELKMPEDVFINSVETDGYTATIFYTGGTFPLSARMAFYNSSEMLPMDVSIDGQPGNLKDMEGKLIKSIETTLQSCVSFDIGTIAYVNGYKWFVRANTGNQGGNGGGDQGGGNGGQQTANSQEFEGFIQSIAAVANALEVTVGKEGNFVTLTVDSQTSILINEQPASIDDLQAGFGAVGYKAKGKYDSSNNHALELMVEGG